MSDLQCVVVTPERTEVDVRAESITLPLFDGELGILKGHSPLVGRLGFGVLRVKSSSDSHNYFVEGGFVQVVDNVVSVLTDRVVDTAEINREVADQAMKTALEMATDQPDLATARRKAIHRAQAMARAVK
jgi:F-type H+-transporting ATPase subunit epsilon